MIDVIFGTKIDQSQAFTSEGKKIPVTKVLASPNVIVAFTQGNQEKDAFVQVGIGKRRIVTVSKALIGQLKKAGLDKYPPRYLREIRLSDLSNSSDLPAGGHGLKPGVEIKVGDVLAEGDTVQVTGISKGKGFAGVVKRHHFKGGPRTHGQSDRERAPGSIGQTTTPGRVYKGKRMAGRMGQDRVTVKNLKVVGIDPEKNILTISGLVPGGRNSLLMIRKLLD